MEADPKTRPTPWNHLTWSAVISAPIGRVQLDCLECAQSIAVRSTGPFGCSACGAAYHAHSAHSSPTYTSFVVRRFRTAGSHWPQARGRVAFALLPKPGRTR